MLNKIEEKLEPVDPLKKVLSQKTTNSGNKRRPSLLKKSQLLDSTIEKQKNVQRPLLRSLKRRKKNKVNTVKKTLDLPGPTANSSVRLTNKKTGAVIRKRIRPRRIRTVPYKTVYPFKSDLNLPKINIAPLSSSQCLVSITDINRSIKTLSIYRREISSRNFEDVYDLVNSIDDPPDSYSFIDDVENARAFKYVCVPDGLPIYSFSVYKNKDFKYENIQEPFSYAFQDGQSVLINLERIPSFCKKLFVYRKSSAEDEEFLVDSVSLFGRGRRRLTMRDVPSPIEQVIQYRFIGIDDDGIENTFEERPMVVYTAKLGQETANITRFSAKYNEQTDEVDLVGEAFVENIFITSTDSELKNPTQQTLEAAARGQAIVKIQVRRINLDTEEDEVILKEIVNPGLSKFESELISLNRLRFKFSDSGENALSFGYTPIFDNTSYAYIARIIVYPLGLELKKVSDFEKIPGVQEAGRLKYEYDPGVFDHPLNTELGILPGTSSSRAYHLADTIGQTTRSFLRRVKVFNADIEDAISLIPEIEIDAAYDPVVKLTGRIPIGLVDNLDHVAIEMSYDTIQKKDIVDRLFLINGDFVYYDYSFDDLACKTVSYRLIGIGKNFRQIFKSEPVKVSLDDPRIKLAHQRRKSLEDYRRRKFLHQQRAKKSDLRQGTRNGRTDGEQ